MEALCDNGRRVPKCVCVPISGVRRCGDVDLDVGAELLCLQKNWLNEFQFRFIRIIIQCTKATRLRILFR